MKMKMESLIEGTNYDNGSKVSKVRNLLCPKANELLGGRVIPG